VDEDDPDIQGVEDCQVEQDIGKIIRRDHPPVQSDHEDTSPELGHIMEDSPEVAKVFHFT